MNTLIITSCTGKKKEKPDNQLTQKDFMDGKLLIKREKELKEYITPAAKMYTGDQHIKLMNGISSLREKYHKKGLDLAIVSAGYGLIKENQKIAPYEVTFNDMKTSEIKQWSEHLKIPENLEKMIKGYDLIIFLLGDKYLRALKLPLNNIKPKQKLVFLASKTSKKLIPSNHPCYFLEVGKKEAKDFKYGLVGLKGHLFKLLSKEIIENDKNLLEKIYQEPEVFMKALSKYKN